MDIQPSKREKLVEQKARRKIEEAERRKNMAENRRHVWEQHRYSGTSNLSKKTAVLEDIIM